jgi:hypothetical protein
MQAVILDRLRAPGARRDAALCRRYAFRVGVGAKDVTGIIAYGILWTILVVLVDASVFMAVVVNGSTTAALQSAALDETLLLAGFVLGWIPFGLWVRRYLRRRVNAILPLFEQGQIYDGRLVEVTDQRSGRARTVRFAVTFSREGAEVRTGAMLWGAPPAGLVEGAVVPVLYLPGHPRSIMFLPNGKLCAS